MSSKASDPSLSLLTFKQPCLKSLAPEAISRFKNDFETYASLVERHSGVAPMMMDLLDPGIRNVAIAKKALKRNSNDKEVIAYINTFIKPVGGVVNIGFVFKDLKYDMRMHINDRIQFLEEQVYDIIDRYELNVKDPGIRKEALYIISNVIQPSELGGTMSTCSKGCDSIEAFFVSLRHFGAIKELFYENNRKDLKVGHHIFKKQSKIENSISTFANTDEKKKETMRKCSYCKKMGHTEDFCWAKKKSNQKKQIDSIKSSSHVSMDHNSSLEFIEAELLPLNDGKPVKFKLLLDGGASCSIIGANHLQMLLALNPDLYVNPAFCDLSLVDKITKLKIVGTTELALKIISSIAITFQVLESNLPYPILGSDVLVQQLGFSMKSKIEKILNDNNYESNIVDKDKNDFIKEKTCSNVYLEHISSDGTQHFRPAKENNLDFDEFEELLLNDQNDNPINNLPQKKQLFPIYDSCDEFTQKKINDIYSRLQSLLYFGNDSMITTPFEVNLIDGTTSITAKPLKLDPARANWLKNHLRELEKNNIIKKRDTISPFSSASFVIPKGMNDYRMVVNYVPLNNKTISETASMEFIDIISNKMVNSQAFLKLDFAKGYFQIPVDPKSQQILSIITMFGSYDVLRLMLGTKNAVHHFTLCAEMIISKPLNSKQLDEYMENQNTLFKQFGIPIESSTSNFDTDTEKKFLWVDDCMGFESNNISLLNLLERVLIRLRDAKCKLNLQKCCFLSNEVAFCGKIYSMKGIRVDESRITSLIQLPRPKNGAELATCLGAFNFFRNHIPNYSSMAYPLIELMNRVGAQAGDRSNKRVKRIPLASLWNDSHSQSLGLLKKFLANATITAYPNPVFRTFIFTDASDVAYGGVLTQTDPIDDNLPVMKRNHIPISFCSGVFNGSSKNWDVGSKETYALLKSAATFKYLIHGSVVFVVDHKNFEYFFKGQGSLQTKTTHRRLARWIEVLAEFDYSVFVIPGVINFFPDMLSRFIPGILDAIKIGDTKSHQVNTVELIGSTLDEEYAWPNRIEIEEAISNFINEHKSLPKGIENGKLFLPTKDLQTRAILGSHCGAMAHRGVDATVAALQDLFYWPNLVQDTKEFIQNYCLHCLVSKGHKIVRPLGNILKGDRPNQVWNMDFFQFVSEPRGKRAREKHGSFANSKYHHLLVILDSFSGYSLLYPMENTTAHASALCVIDAISKFSHPEWITVDRGSAFMADLFDEVMKALQVKKHSIVAFIHTGNAVAERKGRDLLAMFRSLLSEQRIPPKCWSELIPIIQYRINSTPTSRLANHTALEIYLGIKPVTPLQLLLNEPNETKKVQIINFSEEFERILIEFLERRKDEHIVLLNSVNKARSDHRKRNENYIKGKYDPVMPHIEVGDFVMVSVAHDVEKLSSRWHGPYRITDIQTEYVYEVENIVTNKKEDVHLSRLLKWDNKLFNTNYGIKEQAAYLQGGFEIAKIGNHRSKNETMELLVYWFGFEDTDASYEPAKDIFDSAPELVLDYIRSKQEKQVKGLCNFLKLNYKQVNEAKA